MNLHEDAKRRDAVIARLKEKGVDPTGFRFGKRRLMRKKKFTPLKKAIRSDREEAGRREAPRAASLPSSLRQMTSGETRGGALEGYCSDSALAVGQPRPAASYVDQTVDEELNSKVKEMLKEAHRLHRRALQAPPQKQQRLLRLVLGLRQVTRKAALGKLACVIAAPNLESFGPEGSLDSAVANLRRLCEENDIPFVFALSRNTLGKACGKSMRQSVVGLLRGDGLDVKGVASLAQQRRTRHVTLWS